MDPENGHNRFKNNFLKTMFTSTFAWRKFQTLDRVKYGHGIESDMVYRKKCQQRRDYSLDSITNDTLWNILFKGNRYIYSANLLRFLQVQKLLFIKNCK